MFVALLLGCLASSAGCSKPESIVREAAQAATDGDREAYLACFTERSQAMLRALWQISDEKNPKPFELRGQGGDAIQIVETHAIPADRKGVERALTVVAEGTRALPLILHRVGSQWRIDLIDTERIGSGGVDALMSGGVF